MPIKLIGEKINLRSIKRSDADSIFKYANDKVIAKFVTTPYPYKLKDAYDYIRKSQVGMRKKDMYNFGIELKETGEIIGMISLMDVDYENKNAELGYWLARKYWGQKIMPEALRLILKFGFTDLKHKRIYARVMHFNNRSAFLLEKFGFKYEGRLRKTTFRRRRWLDELRYSILKEEFKKKN